MLFIIAHYINCCIS